MNAELIAALCLLPAVLLALALMIDMELSFHRCERCYKFSKDLDDYGYAGMSYCKRCARKEGY